MKMARGTLQLPECISDLLTLSRGGHLYSSILFGRNGSCGTTPRSNSCGRGTQEKRKRNGKKTMILNCVKLKWLESVRSVNARWLTSAWSANANWPERAGSLNDCSLPSKRNATRLRWSGFAKEGLTIRGGKRSWRKGKRRVLGPIVKSEARIRREIELLQDVNLTEPSIWESA